MSKEIKITREKVALTALAGLTVFSAIAPAGTKEFFGDATGSMVDFLHWGGVWTGRFFRGGYRTVTSDGGENNAGITILKTTLYLRPGLKPGA